MPSSRTQQVLELARQAGLVRPRDLAAQGIARTYLSRLVEKGLLQRVGRGLYAPAERDVSAQHTLAQVCKRVPQGVICLLSALQFHGLTTQAPSEVWLAIPRRSRRPSIKYPPLRVLRFSPACMEAGVEVQRVEGVEVRVFSAAKTVADCFRYRNKYGLDVAIEALRDCREQDKCSPADLWRYAVACRVSSVMRPYLEATL
jgi:predicted transcriptional regulator of viral defense system